MAYLTSIAPAMILGALSLHGGAAEAADNVTLITDFGFNGRHCLLLLRARERLLQGRRHRSHDRARAGLGGRGQAGCGRHCAARFRRYIGRHLRPRQRRDSRQARGGDLCAAAARDLCFEGIGHQQTEGPGRAHGRGYGLQPCSEDVRGLCQGCRHRCLAGQMDRRRQRYASRDAVARAGRWNWAVQRRGAASTAAWLRSSTWSNRPIWLNRGQQHTSTRAHRKSGTAQRGKCVRDLDLCVALENTREVHRWTWYFRITRRAFV